MKSGQSEIELKFVVPRQARAAVQTEMTRRPVGLERRRLEAMYLDTPDRRLAEEGIAWRLRREGRRWIQALKAPGASAIERFEHEVIRPGANYDPAVHAGTKVGDRLAKILRKAEADGLEVGVRFRTEVRRIARRIRTKGAVVEVAFDEGRLLANGSKLPIREIEFELVSGSATGLLALAERWRKRFGLVYDPRSKAERGDRLAEGSSFPPLRKAAHPEYPRDASVIEAFGTVMDECLAHISRNAIGLVEGDRDLRAEHVHQLRVGIRRLRSALRSFRGWVPSPPDSLVDELKHLFSELGRARDSDVFDSGVAADLEKAGAPSLTMPKGGAGPDPVELVRSADTQKLLLAWVAWRIGLVESASDATALVTGVASIDADAPSDAAAAATAVDSASVDDKEPLIDGSETAGPTPETCGPTAEERPANPGIPNRDAQLDPQLEGEEGRSFQRKAQRRLAKWHQEIVDYRKSFDELEEEDLHSLRKRIKRQRYAVEFFAPVLRRRDVERYLKPLAAIQDRMGELNDLFVARARYQTLVATDPAAWFALGWLAARVAEVRIMAKPELKLLAKASPLAR